MSFSKRKDAMDQIYLLHCVLMSVLLITVYGNTDFNINCPDQNGTVGKSLNLTCNVTHSSIYQDHIFSHNGTELQNKMKPVNANHTFYYTIANATVNDSGIYAFWIQLSNGRNSINFTVTIEHKKPETGLPAKVTAAIVVSLLSFSLITITILACLFSNLCVSAKLLWEHICR